MKAFDRLVEIVKALRGPEGCPWDKAQTHQTLIPYAIEEAYELEQAIHNQDWQNIKEELGDFLFQSVLHGQLAHEAGHFNIDDVLQELCEKMIRRHPHVFPDSSSKPRPGDTASPTTDDVVRTWESIKQNEKKSSPAMAPLEVPLNFPGLLRAQKIGKKTARVGFDWDTTSEVLSKVDEELSELKVALQDGEKAAIEEELGDLLFSLAQLGRHLDLDTESTVKKANHKFLSRYQHMIESHPQWISLQKNEKEKAWQQSKEALKSLVSKKTSDPEPSTVK